VTYFFDWATRKSCYVIIVAAMFDMVADTCCIVVSEGLPVLVPANGMTRGMVNLAWNEADYSTAWGASEGPRTVEGTHPSDMALHNSNVYQQQAMKESI
jgi:hypothetical protein